ncbi:protein CUSTOS isoform X1 [Periophthalmus magnuspinnatus]|uniref:protein CUSTOS isoform X1 n=1 Tax=Periophthalmus magnuspinnatus TaxID=409849 RepID=UPI00145B72DF|nr:protein CUSTOS isoform X1 [Periophthalmus magnuspinnatus]
MAASSVDMTENSSSSDDEQLKRCREAVWDSPAIRAKDASSNKKASKRLDVADHDHDGNELQVTQGFQIHVAKKLGAMLDSFISEKQSSAGPSVNTETTDNKDDDNEGFRLFSTSVPGQKNEEPSPPKRRPIPSSSDSDSEMEIRLKEAAISIKDLIPPSTSGLPTNSEMPETPTLEIKENIKKKKKKKRKLNPEENGQQDSKCTSDNPNKRITQHDEAQTTKKMEKEEG